MNILRWWFSVLVLSFFSLVVWATPSGVGHTGMLYPALAHDQEDAELTIRERTSGLDERSRSIFNNYLRFTKQGSKHVVEIPADNFNSYKDKEGRATKSDVGVDSLTVPLPRIGEIQFYHESDSIVRGVFESGSHGNVGILWRGKSDEGYSLAVKVYFRNLGTEYHGYVDADDAVFRFLPIPSDQPGQEHLVFEHDLDAERKNREETKDQREAARSYIRMNKPRSNPPADQEREPVVVIPLEGHEETNPKTIPELPKAPPPPGPDLLPDVKGETLIKKHKKWKARKQNGELGEKQR